MLHASTALINSMDERHVWRPIEPPIVPFLLVVGTGTSCDVWDLCLACFTDCGAFLGRYGCIRRVLMMRVYG